MSRTGKPTEEESRLLAANTERPWAEEGVIVPRLDFLFWKGENVMVVQLCEDAKNHWIVYLKKVNLMVYKLYPSKKNYKPLKYILAKRKTRWF